MNGSKGTDTASHGLPDLLRQADFVAATDGLKLVARLNRIRNGMCRENAAEHSWHLTSQAILMAQHAPPQMDLNRVIRLLIIHDLVEIQAGDHWRTDENAVEIAALEDQGAKALFSGLPTR